MRGSMLDWLIRERAVCTDGSFWFLLFGCCVFFLLFLLVSLVCVLRGTLTGDQMRPRLVRWRRVPSACPQLVPNLAICWSKFTATGVVRQDAHGFHSMTHQ